MAASKRVTIPCALNISEQAFEVINRSTQSVPVADAIRSRCEQFVEAMAAGGFMLSADVLNEIQGNYGKTVNTPRDVVKATEAAHSRDEGRSLFSFTIDPAYEIPLAERAKEIGRTPGELMGDVIEYALANQWYLSLEFEGVRKIFSIDQMTFFAEATGKQDFTVADIVTALKARGKRKTEEKSAELVVA